MATIKDVAACAGVSVNTVSRVLNKRGYISEKTYKKVYDAMNRLDYQPNQLARNMYKQRTYFIGLLVPDISHPFFAEMAHRLEILLFNHGYKVILCNTQQNDEREQEYLNMLRQNKVDGAIIGTHMLEISNYEKLSLPIVGMDVYLGNQIPTICADHVRGGTLAARPFIEGNSRCVLQIRGNSDIKTPAWLRQSVFTSKMTEHGIRCIDYELGLEEFDRASYEQIINELLDKHPEIDGIFSTDTIVVVALKCLLERGKSVPDDVILVGYDGVDAIKSIYPPIPYVEQPFDKLAVAIVDTLLRKIDGEELHDNITINDICIIGTP